MDFQNRPGGKTGTGGVASWSEANRDRRERLRQLALETIDLNKDPYFMKNHLGKISSILLWQQACFEVPNPSRWQPRNMGVQRREIKLTCLSQSSKTSVSTDKFSHSCVNVCLKRIVEHGMST